MTITGTIYDNKDGTDIPGASIIVLNSAGQLTSTGIATAPDGSFTLTSPVLDQGGKVMISAVDYQSLVVDPSVFMELGQLGLDQQPQALDAVVVTAKKKSTNYWPLIIGSGILLIAATQKKKKKIGAVDIDWKFLAVAGGIGIVGYYLVVKPILQKLGLGPSAQATANQQAVDKSLNDAKAQGGNVAAQSYTDSDYQGWANLIYDMGFVNPPNQVGIRNIVIQANTLTDLLLLIKAFGTRKIGSDNFFSACQLVDLNCPEVDLPTFLKKVLDAVQINTINQYLADTNINYQL